MTAEEANNPSTVRRRGEQSGSAATETPPPSSGPPVKPSTTSPRGGDGCCPSLLPTPAKVLAIIANETAERWAYYGIKSILVVFLVSLGYSQSASVGIFSLFCALCYFSPLLGSYLADAAIGKLATIMVFNALWLCGISILTAGAFFSNRSAIVAGLIVLAIGVGGIKPNISPLGAEQVEASLRQEKELEDKEQEQEQGHDDAKDGKESKERAARAAAREELWQQKLEEKRRQYFSFFYFGLNCGALLSFIVVPLVRQRYGYGYAFLSCLIIFALSILVFLTPLCCNLRCCCRCKGRCCGGPNRCAGCRGYYDAPPSKDSAWSRCGEVTVKCCRRQNCCGGSARKVAASAVVFSKQVDPLVEPKPVLLPPAAPLTSSSSSSSKGEEGQGAVLAAAVSGALSASSSAGEDTSSSSSQASPAEGSAIISSGNASPSDTASVADPGAGAGENNNEDEEAEDKALLTKKKPSVALALAGSSASAEFQASVVVPVPSAAIHRVPMFAEGDDSTETCPCVNGAVEDELASIVKEQQQQQQHQHQQLQKQTPAVKDWSSKGNGGGDKDGGSVVLLYSSQAGLEESNQKGCCVCCRRRPANNNSNNSNGADGKGFAAAPASSSVPHAALLPLDLYAPSNTAQRSRLKRLQEHVRDVRSILRLLPIFSVLPVFWLIYDSQGSIWTLQRMEMNLCWGSLCAPGPESLGILNPIFIVLLIPLFDRVIIPWFERLGTDKGTKRRNWLFPTPLRRVGVGMQVAALSFVCSAIVQASIDDAAKQGKPQVSQYAQLPQFLFLTISEVLVSITGLEFAYSESPKDMKSTVLALYFISVGVGDLLIAVLYGALRTLLSQLSVILLFACLMSLSGIAFAVLAANYRYNNPAYAEHLHHHHASGPSSSSSSGGGGGGGAGWDKSREIEDKAPASESSSATAAVAAATAAAAGGPAIAAPVVPVPVSVEQEKPSDAHVAALAFTGPSAAV